MTSSPKVNDVEPQDHQEFKMPGARSRLGRAVDVMTDVLLAGFGVAALVSLALLPATDTSTGARTALGIWTGLLGLVVMPGVWILACVPPRKRLREASALVDRAVVFGRSLWSAVVFIGSLAIATAVGIEASATADAQGPNAALDALFGGEMQVLVLRILGVVTLLAASHMIVMWLIDLGAVMRTGEADTLILRLEQRWTGRVNPNEGAAVLRRGIREVAEAGTRIGLPVLAATIIVAYWVGLT
ncbi:hypothetical protein IFT36_04810 [Frigoribacterium sp. CFBP 13605]|uniref:hypothetical protein n=1 Tax=Frigoribacterium sp. CFBP 13605 TaxID=2774034 RepID=UPI0019086B8F|nr:hypothetical protein [Frigoribacterium sp. CFBP 13605]MBD8139864.1 hypothetical protein [Frigoribacterium sp. CFBP 13605]